MQFINTRLNISALFENSELLKNPVVGVMIGVLGITFFFLSFEAKLNNEHCRSLTLKAFNLLFISLFVLIKYLFFCLHLGSCKKKFLPWDISRAITHTFYIISFSADLREIGLKIWPVKTKIFIFFIFYNKIFTFPFFTRFFHFIFFE